MLCAVSDLDRGSACSSSAPTSHPTARRSTRLVGVYAGANWHEREAHEMYGIDFRGHPNQAKLYLPDQFEGNPLRKSFPLLTREVKPWPGKVDVEGMPKAPAEAAPSGTERGEPGSMNVLPPPEGSMTIIDQDVAHHLSEVAVSVELETPDMTLNIGPQHPSTHGVLG